MGNRGTGHRGASVLLVMALVTAGSSLLSWRTGEVSWRNASWQATHLFVSSPEHAPQRRAPVLGLDRAQRNVQAVADPHADLPADPQGPVGRVVPEPMTTAAPVTVAAAPAAARNSRRTADQPAPTPQSQQVTHTPTPTATSVTAASRPTPQQPEGRDHPAASARGSVSKQVVRGLTKVHDRWRERSKKRAAGRGPAPSANAGTRGRGRAVSAGSRPAGPGRGRPSHAASRHAERGRPGPQAYGERTRRPRAKLPEVLPVAPHATKPPRPRLGVGVGPGRGPQSAPRHADPSAAGGQGGQQPVGTAPATPSAVAAAAPAGA